MLLTKLPQVEGAFADEKAATKVSRRVTGGEELLKGFVQIHEQCAAMNLIATPRRFMNFINTYRDVYTAKKKKIEERQGHLKVTIIIYYFHCANNLSGCPKNFFNKACVKLLLLGQIQRK
jgi:dynein heavy chain 2